MEFRTQVIQHRKWEIGIPGKMEGGEVGRPRRAMEAPAGMTTGARVERTGRGVNRGKVELTDYLMGGSY